MRHKTLLLFILAIALMPVGNGLRAQTQTTQPPPSDFTLKVGDAAPDFTLRDIKGQQVSLHDFRGKKNVALAFYVFAFSGG